MELYNCQKCRFITEVFTVLRESGMVEYHCMFFKKPIEDIHFCADYEYDTTKA